MAPTPVLSPGKFMDGGAWWAAVHGVAKSRTRLSGFTFTFHFHALEKEMATHPVFLPGESQGEGSLVGCRLWGHTESDTTEATQQQQQQQYFSCFPSSHKPLWYYRSILNELLLKCTALSLQIAHLNGNFEHMM